MDECVCGHGPDRHDHHGCWVYLGGLRFCRCQRFVLDVYESQVDRYIHSLE